MIVTLVNPPLICNGVLLGGDFIRGDPWGCYLEGQGDLISRLITPITHIVLPIPIIDLVTKSP